MPLLEERHRILNETGKILLEKFGGSFLNCVQKSEKSAQKLMRLVVENFPSYRDEAQFEGKRISFYKRAQILVADTWSVLEGKGDGCFEDISSITMFADYRLPQILVYLGALKYSDDLLKRLHRGLQPTPLSAESARFCFQTTLLCLQNSTHVLGEAEVTTEEKCSRMERDKRWKLEAARFGVLS
ncbi:putative UPF0553 protein C9orf64 like protein [Cricetulus griseus]|nr:putative UPF0553 protein C9orf64 like protein [Cricetulus griseus]